MTRRSGNGAARPAPRATVGPIARAAPIASVADSEAAWQWCLQVADARRAIARGAGPGRAPPEPPDLQDAAADLVDLYRPLLALAPGQRCVVGHLGTSVDGRIATVDGDSRWVSGRADLVHLHRMRALSDAVIVGATTVATDDPQLTTRYVPGPDPVRVVVDPGARAPSSLKVFDASHGPPTLLACAPQAAARAAAYVGAERVVAVPVRDGALDLAALLDALVARGLHVLFVEGGGVTVSRLLQAGLLDRLQVAIAPVIVGSGRDGLQLPGALRMRDCARPPCRLYRLGEDVLFDYDLRGAPRAAPADDTLPRRIA